MAHDIFVSYAHEDRTVANAVVGTLESHGIRCWIAPRDIIPGEDWGSAILDAIKEAHALVLVFSSHSNESEQIKREVERTVHQGTAVIPFRIEDVLPSKTLEYFISTQHWLDAMTPPLEDHLVHLAETITVLLAKKRGKEIPRPLGGEEPAVLRPERRPEVPPAEPQPVITVSAPPRKFPMIWVILLVGLLVVGIAGGIWWRWSQPVVSEKKTPAPAPVAQTAQPPAKLSATKHYSGFEGKWTGKWSNSLGESGNDSLVLSEEPNGNLRGLWSNEVAVSGQLTGSNTASLAGQTATRAYQIRARVEGDRMTLQYSATRLNATGSYNGESRFTRIMPERE